MTENMGFVTKNKAKKLGMTHTIRLYGILPGYGSDFDGDCNITLAHPLLELIEEYILGPMNNLASFILDQEPVFPIVITGRIKQ